MSVQGSIDVGTAVAPADASAGACDAETSGGADATCDAGGSAVAAEVGSAGDADPLQAATPMSETIRSAGTAVGLESKRRMASVLSWIVDRDAAHCRTPGLAGPEARLEQGDRLGDPVGRQLNPVVELLDEGLVGGDDEREHHLVGRHQDRSDVL